MNGDEQSTERTVLVGWVEPKAKPNAFKTVGFQIHPAKLNPVKAISQSRFRYTNPIGKCITDTRGRKRK